MILSIRKGVRYKVGYTHEYVFRVYLERVGGKKEGKERSKGSR